MDYRLFEHLESAVRIAEYEYYSEDSLAAALLLGAMRKALAEAELYRDRRKRP